MTRVQSFIAIIITMLLGTTGFTTLNNLNSLNQVQQTLAGLSAAVVNQKSVPSAIESSGSNQQVEGSGEVTPTTHLGTQSEASNHALQISSGQPLLLLRDTQSVRVSLIYSSTSSQIVTVTVELLVAQSEEGNALNVGYHSNTEITLTHGITKTVELHFNILPPTGSYTAQLVAYADNLLTTQSVTLIVANQPGTTLQQQIPAFIPDGQIVIAGGRYWPLSQSLCSEDWKEWCNYAWGGYPFRIPQKSLDSNQYKLMVSKLYDSVNSHSARLDIQQDGNSLLSVSESATLTVSTVITIIPLDIKYPGAYTGTLTIVDEGDGSTEMIPVRVNARVYSLVPFIVIFLVSWLVGSFVLGFGSQGSLVWALLASIVSMGYIESRLPTFGNTKDYYATLSLVITGTALGAWGTSTIQGFKNSFAGVVMGVVFISATVIGGVIVILIGSPRFGIVLVALGIALIPALIAYQQYGYFMKWKNPRANWLLIAIAGISLGAIIWIILTEVKVPIVVLAAIGVIAVVGVVGTVMVFISSGIAIKPVVKTLPLGHPQQFTIEPKEIAVTWKISPDDQGIIEEATGNYTAPADCKYIGTEVTITAETRDKPKRSDSVTVKLMS